MNPIRLLSLVLLAGCAVADASRVNPKGLRIVAIDGRDMLEIPAGEFLFGDQLLYLPTFLIDIEPGPPTPHRAPADEYQLAKATQERTALPERTGTRCVHVPATPARPAVQWRADFWSAVDEARRRNVILFVSLHWDG